MSCRLMLLTAALLLPGCWDRVQLAEAKPVTMEIWPSVWVLVLPSDESHMCVCPASR